MAETPAPDITVIGSINTDYMALGERLPTGGETVRADVFRVSAGGKGANQAVAAARLGARVALVGRIGDDDRGEAVLRYLESEGVDTYHVARETSSPTGAALIHVDKSGEKQIMGVSNANAALAADDIRQAEGTIRNSPFVLVQLQVPLEALLETARLVAQTYTRLCLDPSPPRDIPPELYRRLFLMKPNTKEASALTGIDIVDRDSAWEAAKALLERGIQSVAVQAGSAGNVFGWQSGGCFVPRVPVSALDATGAGDALLAALAVALSEGQPWPDAAMFASAAAALTTTKIGAQASLPYRTEVDQLLVRIGKTIQCERIE